jgi:transcriptional regulator of acetoin/glycerol metabolism
MNDATLSNRFERWGGTTGAIRRPILHVAFQAGQPFEPPSRHLLDDVDVVCFGRGARSATRDVQAGLRRLVLRLPDPVMSSDHGRLLSAHGQWLLEDERSKNGAVVAGRPTRCAQVGPGDLFELGHTLFALELAEVDRALPRDLLASDLRPPCPALATLDARLVGDIALLERVAPSAVPVLLFGATGTGKEVFARALHTLSGRGGPFVAVNCGGLAANLVEAELFGHRRGSFSGAVGDRLGYLRSADRGTLFLDELGELPIAAQTALLRALQEREVVPVGDAAPVRVDLRVVAATNRDLGDMVAAGSFREDLYARLLGVHLTLPALEDRRCDLGLLIASLLRRLPDGGRARFSPAAAYALFRHRWPLNVRELERTLAAALALAGGDPIDIEHLPPAVVSAASEDEPTPAPPLERDRLEALMLTHRGNVSRVADALGTSRSQVRRLAARFGLAVDAFRRT